MKLIETKYLLIERNAYMGYSNCRYFDNYGEAKIQFEELKKIGCPCTIIAFDYIESYQKQYSNPI